MENKSLQAATLQFLTDLKANNNREWFAANKTYYDAALKNMTGFADELLHQMGKHDHLSTASGKASLYRIYADTRFSKEKAPYKTHWGMRFARATDALRGGYYLHIEPGNTFAAGGFFSPNPEDLKRIREDISFNYEDWDTLFAAPALTEAFGTLQGEQVKTAPKGFDKNHPGIDWLRYKQFLLRHSFTDREVLQPDFVTRVDLVFQQLRPFFDYMSEVLTTDANGESIL